MMSEEWKHTQKEFGFEIKLDKPIQEYTAEELDNLDSDCYMLEGEHERIRKIVTDEQKRREENEGQVD